MDQPWLIAGLLLAAASVYLASYVYRRFAARLEQERAHARKMAELHLATIEALLHDIGKLAVPEHILNKPGPLTPEEFQKVRIHPQVGAEIIAGVPFPYPVVPLILSHHERWDGRGYPAGLKQDEIPLGARILCVADYFDALTSDRPYHKSIGNEAALAILQQDAGKALDPTVVATFARLMPCAPRWRRRRSRRRASVRCRCTAARGCAPSAPPRPRARRRRSSPTSRSPTARSTPSTRSPRRWGRAWG
jgi:HD-GYP domain-containing protein (c-di-GMP phosphodiesterase class II)